jgi:predicted Fe-Mo cluster-binding NifX family protein
VSDGRVPAPEILENRFADLERGKGIRLAEFLVEKGIDTLYTKEDFKGKGPEFVLSDAGVDLRKTDLKTLKELMEWE